VFIDTESTLCFGPGLSSSVEFIVDPRPLKYYDPKIDR